MTGRTASWPGPAGTATTLGLAMAKLVVTLLVPAGQPVLVAIDDTLCGRRRQEGLGRGWFHDGSAQGPGKTRRGNNWVVAAIVVRLPFTPARRPAGAGQTGRQGHQLGVAAVAGPPHERR